MLCNCKNLTKKKSTRPTTSSSRPISIILIINIIVLFYCKESRSRDGCKINFSSGKLKEYQFLKVYESLLK